METPFVFGKIASEDDFTDREIETQHLLNNFNGLVNTILISPRRWGKSSLVSKAARLFTEQSSDNIVINLDLFSCRTEEVFYKEFANAVIAATNTVFEDFVSTALRYLGRFAPSFSASDPVGSFELSFGIDIKDKRYDTSEIFDLPQKLAIEKNKRIIVCIDEFQTIKEYKDTLAFQRILRSYWQKHNKVAYCLYGSKRNMMAELFADSNSPFYKFGDLVFLQKISREDWIEFIVKRFKDTGKAISNELAGYIADKVDNHPYYVQQLSQLVWFRTLTECTVDKIDSAFEGLEAQLSLVYSLVLDSLTPTQISFLQAVAAGETKMTSQNVLSQYRLGSSANVKGIKQALEKKELIDVLPNKISIQDPVFMHWLLTQY